MQRILSIFKTILTPFFQDEASKPTDIGYKIKNGILYLTAEQLTENDGLTIASEYCAKSKDCAYIYLPFGTHEVGYNVELHCDITATKGTTLVLKPANPSTPAIGFVRKRFYVEYPTVSNIEFVLQANCLAVIQTGRSHKALIDNCNFEVNNKADYGIIIGNATDKGSIGSLVNQTRIVRANESAVLMLETGGKHRFDECQFRLNKAAITMDRGMLVLQNSEGDKNENQLIITGDESCFISNCTFEGGVFNIKNIKVFSITESKSAGCEFLFDNVDYLDIDKTKMNASSISDGAGNVSITGNYWQPPANYEKVFELYCNERNTLKGNSTGRGIELKTCKK